MVQSHGGEVEVREGFVWVPWTDVVPCPPLNFSLYSNLVIIASLLVYLRYWLNWRLKRLRDFSWSRASMFLFSYQPKTRINPQKMLMYFFLRLTRMPEEWMNILGRWRVMPVGQINVWTISFMPMPWNFCCRFSFSRFIIVLSSLFSPSLCAPTLHAKPPISIYNIVARMYESSFWHTRLSGLLSLLFQSQLVCIDFFIGWIGHRGINRRETLCMCYHCIFLNEVVLVLITHSDLVVDHVRIHVNWH